MTQQEALKLINDFGTHLQEKRSPLEYLLFAGLPENILPGGKISNIKDAGKIVIETMGKSHPAYVKFVQENLDTLLSGYVDLDTAKNNFKIKINQILENESTLNNFIEIISIGK
jgi:hypothetical protein